MFSRVLSLAVLVTGATAFVAPTGSRVLRAARRSLDPLNMGALDIVFDELDGEAVRVGIITTRWNKEIIDSLSTGVKGALTECNVSDANVFETQVPGAYELPLAARFLALSGTVDAIVCVGCLIKGDTQHFEYISNAVSVGLMNVGLQTSVPVVFGVLTVNNEQQAKDRAFGPDNHGLSWGKTAVRWRCCASRRSAARKAAAAAALR